MYGNVERAEETLRAAVAVAEKGPAHLAELDSIDAPVYLTDACGTLTYFNRACIEFAGRTPRLGADSWCVSWRLFTEEGEALAHESCPMAVALKEQREVRGVNAVAERPDGTRIPFRPYPTPLRDREGRLVGGLNLLVGLPDRSQIEFLQTQARRCSRLAASTTDERTAGTLSLMAAEYAAEAERLERLRAC